MSKYSQVGLDELLERGAALESDLYEIESELPSLEAEVESEGSHLRRSLRKTGLSAGSAFASIMAAPVTMGWSLLAAILPAVHASMEIHEAAADYERLRPLKQRLAFLQQLAMDTRRELEAIKRELDSRV